jgi:Xaa-Pro aminopeptidase
VPIKIVHRIEAGSLDHLPGEIVVYLSWQSLENLLSHLLKDVKTVAMEYSPRNAIPYVSKVDGGTLELIRSFDVDVVSSADLLQQYSSVWSDEQFQSHLYATEVLEEAVADAWELIAACLKENEEITEYDVQQFILSEFDAKGCITDHAPICAVNGNAANPHYVPTLEASTTIKLGDFVLIDLWCKKNSPKATYGDITRVGVAAAAPTSRQKEIFAIVKEARNSATALVEERFARKEPVMGWEVDATARKVIEDAGYGEYFIHRTGHNIDEIGHGDGANIDNLETQDCRHILKGTCFSIEPGIYLPGEFGVRLEYDVYVHQDGAVQVTGGVQEEIVCITSLIQSSQVL